MRYAFAGFEFQQFSGTVEYLQISLAFFAFLFFPPPRPPSKTLGQKVLFFFQPGGPKYFFKGFFLGFWQSWKIKTRQTPQPPPGRLWWAVGKSKTLGSKFFQRKTFYIKFFLQNVPKTIPPGGQTNPSGWTFFGYFFYYLYFEFRFVFTGGKQL